MMAAPLNSDSMLRCAPSYKSFNETSEALKRCLWPTTRVLPRHRSLIANECVIRLTADNRYTYGGKTRFSSARKRSEPRVEAQRSNGAALRRSNYNIGAILELVKSLIACQLRTDILGVTPDLILRDLPLDSINHAALELQVEEALRTALVPKEAVAFELDLDDTVEDFAYHIYDKILKSSSS